MNSGTHLVSSNTLVDVAYHNIRKDIIERDERDMNREISPLKQAEPHTYQTGPQPPDGGGACGEYPPQGLPGTAFQLVRAG